MRYARALFDVAHAERQDLDADRPRVADCPRCSRDNEGLQRALSPSRRFPASRKRAVLEQLLALSPVTPILSRAAAAARRSRSARAAPGAGRGVSLAADGSPADRAGRRSRRRWRCRRTASPRSSRGWRRRPAGRCSSRCDVDPAILGGAVARIGSTVYDGSITTQLREAEAAVGRIGNRRRSEPPRRHIVSRHMNIKAEEISKIIRDQIGNYAVDVDVAEVGTIVSIGDGIARVHGVENTMAGEMLEFPHGVFGIALNLEEESVGAVLLGEYTEIKEGDTVKRTNRIISVPVGEELVGRVVNALGQPIDGKGPIVSKQTREIERIAPGRRRSVAGQGAAADRAQGDRRDGADRPRPARADHRRPPDRQDRGRRRRDHQPEGAGRHLHLQRDRAEAVDDRAGGADAGRSRRDGVHHRRRGRRVGSGAAALHQPVFGVRDGRVLPRQRPARAAASTTISRSTRRRTARSRCCCAGRRAAKPIPATSSTCTRGCSSARRRCARSSAADR